MLLSGSSKDIVNLQLLRGTLMEREGPERTAVPFRPSLAVGIMHLS